MHVIIGADHRGFKLKNELKDWLTGQGHEVEDVGPAAYDESDDYPDFAVKVGEEVALRPVRQAQGKANALGIVVCGSGVGMAVAANKVPGIRAGLVHDVEMAKVAREHDDLNVLALGSDFISSEAAKEVVKAWLEANYSGEERHTRRIKKIEEYESQ